MGRKIAGYGVTCSPNRELKNVRHSVVPPHQFCNVSGTVTFAIPGVHRSTPAGIEYKLTTVTPYPMVPITQSVTCHVASASIRVSNHNAPIITSLQMF